MSNSTWFQRRMTSNELTMSTLPPQKNHWYKAKTPIHEQQQELFSHSSPCSRVLGLGTKNIFLFSLGSQIPKETRRQMLYPMKIFLLLSDVLHKDKIIIFNPNRSPKMGVFSPQQEWATMVPLQSVSFNSWASIGTEFWVEVLRS